MSAPRLAPRSSRPAAEPVPGGLIAALYARGLLDHLRARGVDPADLYPAARVAELEQARGHTEIPLHEWIAMFDTAIAALDDPELPLKAGAGLRMRHLGVLGPVLMNCRTLAEVQRQLARYIRLLGQIGEPVLTVEGDRAHLLWSWPYATRPHAAVAQFMMGARAMFMRWLSNRPDLRYDGYFHFGPPRDPEPYRQIFGGRLHFDQDRSEMRFPASYLELPVVSADEDLRAQVEAQAQAVLRQLSGEPDFVRTLKAVLTHNLARGQVALHEAAAAMDVSARTLQRRLGELGRSYQGILDEVRLASAQNYLRSADTSLTQIAFLLGYSEQSSFHNAFKRWTRLSPGAWRRQHLARR
ncbi:AraC family transcriptional regulator ligand-binding domain-containing protein [Fontimonas sp. SYSU GA230001]|uniref:AraC family transcriptional regulator n=1 Tax=Fontimonas sp. SYSU GA230001 TaxID=3142450 RepID=UPI0032B4A36B